MYVKALTLKSKTQRAPYRVIIGRVSVVLIGTFARVLRQANTLVECVGEIETQCLAQREDK